MGGALASPSFFVHLIQALFANPITVYIPINHPHGHFRMFCVKLFRAFCRFLPRVEC